MLKKNFITIYYSIFITLMIGQKCLICSTYPTTISDVSQDLTKTWERIYTYHQLFSVINAFTRDNSVDA